LVKKACHVVLVLDGNHNEQKEEMSCFSIPSLQRTVLDSRKSKSESNHVDGEDRHQGSSIPVICDPPSVVDLSDDVVQGIPWNLILFKQGSSEDYSEMGGRGKKGSDKRGG
jgi:hypothetical protein